MIPPAEEPDDAIPTARPVLVIEYVGIEDAIGIMSKLPLFLGKKLMRAMPANTLCTKKAP